MKLKQLSEAFEQQTGDFPDTSKHDPATQGRGAFASVVGDEDPFMINKSAYNKDEAYDIYVKMLVDNKLAQSNPHFPRIYEISNGKWKMEKLPYTLYSFFNDGDYHENKHNKEMICDVYLKTSENFSYYDFADPREIKLGSYKKALEIIHEYAKKHNANRTDSDKYLGDDLHSKNIMVRLTPQGPQLVITDPWC